MQFLEQILAWAKIHPEKLAVIFEQDGLTYSQLAERVYAAQVKLAANGVNGNRTVALSLDNPLIQLPVFLALMRMGVTSINCTAETILSTASIGVRTFVTQRLHGLPAHCAQIVIGDDWLSGAQASDILPAAGYEDGQPASVWYSSGSSGYPRAYASTWDSMANRVANLQWILPCARFERAVIIPSITVAFGGYFSLAFLASGSSIVLREGNLDNIILDAELLAFDFMCMSTAQMAQIVDIARSNAYYFHRLEGALYAGAETTRTLVNEALAYVSKDLAVLYAATEAGTIAYNKVSRMPEGGNWVGRPAPWAEVRIVDANQNDLPLGQEGEVLVRTNGHWSEYRGQVAIQGAKSALWIKLGDIGKFNDAGELVITGRLSDVINLGGIKIAPERIESILRANPNIMDAAAVGVMSEATGAAQLHVFVVVRQNSGSDAEELLAWWRGHVDGLLIDQMSIVDFIPRTESGKIARYKLSGGAVN